MIKHLVATFFGLLILIYSNLSFAKAHCSLEEKTIDKTNTKEAIFKNKDPLIFKTEKSVVLISLIKEKLRYELKEYFGNSKKEYYKYSFICDQNLVCSGARELVSKTQNKKDKFTITKTQEGQIAMIGNRLIISFSSLDNGFKIEHLKFQIDSENYGLKLRCRFEN